MARKKFGRGRGKRSRGTRLRSYRMARGGVRL